VGSFLLAAAAVLVAAVAALIVCWLLYLCAPLLAGLAIAIACRHRAPEEPEPPEPPPGARAALRRPRHARAAGRHARRRRPLLRTAPQPAVRCAPVSRATRAAGR
jgi:hypothetical protein